jgi:hypothetical protein
MKGQLIRSHHFVEFSSVDFEETADLVLEIGHSEDSPREDSQVLVLRETLLPLVVGGRHQPVLYSGELSM